jgi:hypothetical protein
MMPTPSPETFGTYGSGFSRRSNGVFGFPIKGLAFTGIVPPHTMFRNTIFQEILRYEHVVVLKENKQRIH